MFPIWTPEGNRDSSGHIPGFLWSYTRDFSGHIPGISLVVLRDFSGRIILI